MPNINDLKESRYLTKADCGKGILMTITGCVHQNVAMDNQPPDMKWCLTFQESPKPMVLNSVNGQLIASFLGSEQTEDWIGQQIVLYNDPSIMFQGRLTGGIRTRAPRSSPQQGHVQPAPQQRGYAPAVPPPQHAYPQQQVRQPASRPVQAQQPPQQPYYPPQNQPPPPAAAAEPEWDAAPPEDSDVPFRSMPENRMARMLCIPTINKLA